MFSKNLGLTFYSSFPLFLKKCRALVDPDFESCALKRPLLVFQNSSHTAFVFIFFGRHWLAGQIWTKIHLLADWPIMTIRKETLILLIFPSVPYSALINLLINSKYCVLWSQIAWVGIQVLPLVS